MATLDKIISLIIVVLIKTKASKMKKIAFTIVTILVLGFLVIAGVNYLRPGSVKTFVEGGKSLAEDKIRELEELIKKKTVLPDAKTQLENTQNARKTVEKSIREFETSNLSSELHIQKKNKEIAKNREEFISLQETAKKNDLPKEADAETKDRVREILGDDGYPYTGQQIYNSLRSYKKAISLAEEIIEQEKQSIQLREEQMREWRKRVDRYMEQEAVLARQINILEVLHKSQEIDQSLTKVDLPPEDLEIVKRIEQQIREMRAYLANAKDTTIIVPSATPKKTITDDDWVN